MAAGLVGQTRRGKKPTVPHQIIPTKDMWPYHLLDVFASALCQQSQQGNGIGNGFTECLLFLFRKNIGSFQYPVLA